jgi:hypothetical protein
MVERVWARVREWLGVLARQPLLFLLVLLFGGTSGVLYTCGPLHSAKTWQLDYLDTQLSIQNQRVRELEDALEQRSLDSEGALTPSAATALRKDLEAAEKRRDQNAAKVTAAEDRLAKANESRDRWRTKHRTAEAELNRVREEKDQLAAEREGLRTKLSEVGSSTAPPPAAIAPGATLLANGLELMVGESWSSPDGRVSFEVVDVDEQIASLRGSWQSSMMTEPERVSAGHELTEQQGDATYRIAITAVSPYRSITIRVAGDAP